MFEIGSIVLADNVEVQITQRVYGDEEAGCFEGKVGDNIVFVGYGNSDWAECLEAVLSESIGLPNIVARANGEASLIVFEGSAKIRPFSNSEWRSLSRERMIKGLSYLTASIRSFHQRSAWLHGIRRDEIYWDDEKDRLLIVAHPRLRFSQRPGPEASWRDLKLIGELLFEGYLQRDYPGGHEMAALLQERDKITASGVGIPGLPQLLAGSVSPYGDLAFSGAADVAESLDQIAAELQPRFGFEVGESSTVGNYIFRKNNQDSCGHAILSSICGSRKMNIGFFVVADGIGGIEDGERASGLAVETAISSFSRAWVNCGVERIYNDPNYFARTIAKAVGQRLALEGEFSPERNRGGTTFSAMLIVGDRAAVCHVGDSRIVVIRDNQIVPMTHDHTLANILIKLGDKKAEEIDADDVSQRTISRFLSTSMEVEWDRVDGFGEEINRLYPETLDGYLTIKTDDMFLLTSDGAHGEVTSDQLVHIIGQTEEDPQGLCDALVENALDNVGRDNSTVVAVHVR